jgi:uncharacterized membrane protein SpoIIM required for sporulation
MREASFLAKNEKKWRKVETILDKRIDMHPDESIDLFQELTDDLSYSRTNYPKSIATQYLNLLTAGIYQKINKRKVEKWNRILVFWREDVPLAVAQKRHALFYSLLFFLLSMTIGIVSTHYDENFPRIILGDSYVDLTLENIENNDPMGIYKSQESGNMFLAISSNNLRVATLTFVAGLFFSLGSYYFLFINGVMVGTFQYFFLQKGLFWDSFLSIWIHGTIEISCIVIAGGAGIALGSSLLYPGTLRRKKSLMIGGKRAFKIFIGILPLIVIAGFLESYITRLTDSSIFVKASIIGGSFAFIIWYFAIYPYQLLKRKLVEE